MTGKLMFVPDTHAVVPKEPTYEMSDALLQSWKHGNSTTKDALISAIKASPPLTTPPVLRWEGYALKIYDAVLLNIFSNGGYEKSWAYTIHGNFKSRSYPTEQEARRAAEKALGFPDWLVVEEV